MTAPVAKPPAAKPAAAKTPATKKAPREVRVTGAKFIASVSGIGEVPPGMAEFAMCGRSNVGKSSLINALCNQKQLARVSKTPGRTQRINLFDVDLSSGQTIRLVDLPGFGHAEVPGAVQRQFSPMIQAYLLEQPALRAVLLLVDARRDPDPDAIGFAEWLSENHVPVVLIVTKSDKVPKTERFGVQEKLRRAFGQADRPLLCSSQVGDGMPDLLRFLRDAAGHLPRAKKSR